MHQDFLVHLELQVQPASQEPLVRSVLLEFLVDLVHQEQLVQPVFQDLPEHQDRLEHQGYPVHWAQQDQLAQPDLQDHQDYRGRLDNQDH